MRRTRAALLIARAFLAEPTARHYGAALTAVTGVTSGALYPLLHRMAAEGLITDTTTAADEAADHAAGRPSRRYYEIANQSGLAHFVGDDAPLTELINRAKTELERLLSLQTNQGDIE